MLEPRGDVAGAVRVMAVGDCFAPAPVPVGGRLKPWRIRAAATWDGLPHRPLDVNTGSG
jgi:hypothetical protein